MVAITSESNLYNKSRDFTLRNIVEAKSLEELKRIINNKKIALASLCNSKKCEEVIKDKTGAKTLNIPFEQPENQGNCISCGKKSSYLVRIAKSY